MIHIAYTIQNSSTHGIGLFAGENIQKGDLIYSPSPFLDVDITQEQFNSLSSSEQKEVVYYGYFHPESNRWHVAFDAIRILNHGESDRANVTQDKGMVMKAKRDIQKGEEILQDYREIWPEESEHFKRINSYISHETK
jgi:SET domain-containing protein